MTSLDVTNLWRFRQTSENVIICLKINYTVNRRHWATQIDVHRERTVVPRTARALASKSARNTVETSKAASYRWLLAQTKVSPGFRNEAVIAKTSVGLLWTYGPTQASQAALVSLCQKVVDTERTPPSGPRTRSLVTFTWNQQKGRRLLHGCPPANDSFQWLAWRNDHQRRRR